MTATTAVTRPLRAVELEVLESIYSHRLMTTIQLWQLHTPAGETRQDRWMQRIVAHLRRRGLIASVGRHGTPQLACWYATERGAEAIEAAGTYPGRRVLVTPHGADGMLQSHTLAVNDVGVAFATAAKRHGHDCGHLAWQHEVAHRIADGHGGVRGGNLLVADALLCYAANVNGRVTLVYRFIELDRATMSPHDVGDKLRRYVRYASFVPKDAPGSRPAWRDRYPGLPGVLLILAGKPRPRLESRLEVLVGLYQIDPVLRDADAPALSVCLLEDLQRHGPFAGIFTRPNTPEQPVDLLGRPRPSVSNALAATGTEGAR